jgi:hypothetical protein
MEKKKIITISAVILFLIILLAGVWWFKKGGNTTNLGSRAVKSVFKKEGVVFSNPNYHNLEIIKLDNGNYRMFFHEGAQIKSAISNDAKNFSLEEGIRLIGSMPASVKLKNGNWRMYFASGPTNSIKSAISSDGFTFKEEEGVRLNQGPPGSLDQAGLVHPSVISLPDGSFKMYYDGVSSSQPGQSGPSAWTIMSATSKDGLIWTKNEGARIKLKNALIESAWSPHAEFENGIYLLYFSGGARPITKSGVWKATSKDGLNFTLEKKPVLGRDQEHGDRIDESSMTELGPKGVPQDPFLLHTPNGDRLFYWTPDQGLQSAFH